MSFFNTIASRFSFGLDAHWRKQHKWGLLAVLAAFLLSLPGLHWGKYECWNLDQMALLPLQKNYLPTHYLKPPLHTYVNQVLLLPVVKVVLKPFIHTSKQAAWKLLAARLLTISMFAASVWFLYLAALRGGGVNAAAPLALLYGTSAGILVFDRFLTADTPLLFWMLASFIAALKATETKTISWALFSGILAGLATADKYNGLWAGAALPAAYFATVGWRCFRLPAFWIGGCCVPLGFALGNPGALFDTQRFWDDFYYNLLTTPAYDGQTTGTGYWKFLTFFPEILGWPGTLVLGCLFITTLILLIRRKLPSPATVLLLAAVGVFLPYYLSIGKFPRMGTRFVLPAIPFLLLFATPAIATIPWKSILWKSGFALLLLYNVICSLEVGLRFLEDPRMESLRWVPAHIPVTAHFETTYSPQWNRNPDYRPEVHEMPTVTGRSKMFSEMFAKEATFAKSIARHETPTDASVYFTKEALSARNPDVITFTSHVFDWTGDDSVREFYNQLDREELSYKKTYERTARKPPWWMYPQGIDFIPERMIILQKNAS